MKLSDVCMQNTTKRAKSTTAFMLFLLFIGGCSHQHKSTESDNAITVNYTEKGRSICKQTFEILNSNLKTAMQKGSIAYAITYCNTTAQPLTDSLSKANNVTIKRTSLQLRNPANQPTEVEKALLQHFQQLKEIGADISQTDTLLLLENKSYLFAKPILLQPQCVICHGKPGETLLPEIDSLIKNLYPSDRATGFSVGDLRGMWSIVFKQ